MKLGIQNLSLTSWELRYGEKGELKHSGSDDFFLVDPGQAAHTESLT